MREIESSVISDTIARLCIEANCFLPDDIDQAIKDGKKNEITEMAKETLDVISDNAQVARKLQRPICQDTGMACVFVEIGQDVHVSGDLNKAINDGVAKGYTDGYLRKSVVDDPLFDRRNTNDNTPAIINYDIVPGDKLKLIVAPKGFGSENMCMTKMLKPSDGVEGVKQFVLEAVNRAGPNPCPPMVIGVGIGGNFDRVALLAKKAMLKNVDEHHPDERYAKLEQELLEMVNATGYGPAGFGGATTALTLHIEEYPTHIAGLPVAVAICCHVARHKEAVL